MTFRLFPLLRTEVSRRLGQEHVAPEGDVRGGIFSDVVIAGADTGDIATGAGDDIILAEPGAERMLDGGRGADTYVLAGGAPEAAEIEECLIFDYDDGGVSTRDPEAGDRAVLPDFDPASTITDLGAGRVEIADPDGRLVRLEVQFPDGSPVPFDAIAARIDLGPPDPAGAIEHARPLLIIAEDVEGEALAGTVLSDTILYADSTAEVRGGFGADVIASLAPPAATLRPDPAAVSLFGGPGDDLILADARAELVHGGRGADDLRLALAEAPSGRVPVRAEGGPGADRIEADFRGLPAGTGVEVAIAGGRGPDTLVLLYESGAAEIEACLIFDFGDGGLGSGEGADEVILGGFGPGSTLTDLGQGRIEAVDPLTGLSAGIGIEVRDGTPLALADLLAAGVSFDLSGSGSDMVSDPA